MPSERMAEVKAALPRMAVLAGVWLALVGLLVAAGEIVVHSTAVTHFDQHATSVLVNSRTAALNSAMKTVTWLGSWVALILTAVIIAMLVRARRLPLVAAVVAVFAWAGVTGGVRISKEIVARDRPPDAIRLVAAHGWSFPSGHAAAASLAFTVLALCVTAVTGHRAVRVLGWLIAGLAIAATAFSRVELGVHWTTDVLASVVFTAAWLTAIAAVLGGRLRSPSRGLRPACEAGQFFADRPDLCLVLRIGRQSCGVRADRECRCRPLDSICAQSP